MLKKGKIFENLVKMYKIWKYFMQETVRIGADTMKFSWCFFTKLV